MPQRGFKPLSADQVRALPAAVDLKTAGEAFGLGRTITYELAATGEFPCPVLQFGRLKKVTRASIMQALGISEFDPAEQQEAG